MTTVQMMDTRSAMTLEAESITSRAQALQVIEDLAFVMPPAVIEDLQARFAISDDELTAAVEANLLALDDDYLNFM